MNMFIGNPSCYKMQIIWLLIALDNFRHFKKRLVSSEAIAPTSYMLVFRMQCEFQKIHNTYMSRISLQVHDI